MGQTQFSTYPVNSLFWAPPVKISPLFGDSLSLTCFNSSEHLSLAAMIWFIYLFTLSTICLSYHNDRNLVCPFIHHVLEKRSENILFFI